MCRSTKSAERKHSFVCSAEVNTYQLSWSSICRGATLWGLENSSFLNSANRTIAARIARYSYGYCAGTRFDPLRHAIEDQYYNKRGELYARQQMFWFIQRVFFRAPFFRRIN